ncbi:MAG: hypothetical protein QNJ44_03900 [Rhodobacter sp.]|nr:hypothetical protein [Rhodobacter sp.]
MPGAQPRIAEVEEPVEAASPGSGVWPVETVSGAADFRDAAFD